MRHMRSSFLHPHLLLEERGLGLGLGFEDAGLALPDVLGRRVVGRGFAVLLAVGLLGAASSSSVPVEGGFATVSAAEGRGAAVGTGAAAAAVAVGTGVVTTGTGGATGAASSPPSCVMSATAIAATTMPPPMNSPVLFFCA